MASTTGLFQPGYTYECNPATPYYGSVSRGRSPSLSKYFLIANQEGTAATVWAVTLRPTS